jgi:hypothetical protein
LARRKNVMGDDIKPKTITFLIIAIIILLVLYVQKMNEAQSLQNDVEGLRSASQTEQAPPIPTDNPYKDCLSWREAIRLPDSYDEINCLIGMPDFAEVVHDGDTNTDDVIYSFGEPSDKQYKVVHAWHSLPYYIYKCVVITGRTTNKGMVVFEEIDKYGIVGIKELPKEACTNY